MSAPKRDGMGENPAPECEGGGENGDLEEQLQQSDEPESNNGQAEGNIEAAAEYGHRNLISNNYQHGENGASGVSLQLGTAGVSVTAQSDMPSDHNQDDSKAGCESANLDAIESLNDQPEENASFDRTESNIDLPAANSEPEEFNTDQPEDSSQNMYSNNDDLPEGAFSCSSTINEQSESGGNQVSDSDTLQVLGDEPEGGYVPDGEYQPSLLNPSGRDTLSLQGEGVQAECENWGEGVSDETEDSVEGVYREGGFGESPYQVSQIERAEDDMFRAQAINSGIEAESVLESNLLPREQECTEADNAQATMSSSELNDIAPSCTLAAEAETLSEHVESERVLISDNHIEDNLVCAERSSGQEDEVLSQSDTEENIPRDSMCNDGVEADSSSQLNYIDNPNNANNSVENSVLIQNDAVSISEDVDNAPCDGLHSAQSSPDATNERAMDSLESNICVVNSSDDHPPGLNGPSGENVLASGEDPEDGPTCQDATSSLQGTVPRHQTSPSDADLYAPECDRQASESQSVLSSMQPDLPLCQQNSDLLQDVELGPSGACAAIAGDDLQEGFPRSADLIQSITDARSEEDLPVTEDISSSNDNCIGSQQEFCEVSLVESCDITNSAASSSVLLSNNIIAENQKHSASNAIHSNDFNSVDALPSSVSRTYRVETETNNTGINSVMEDDLLNELDAELEPISSRGNNSVTTVPINGMRVQPALALCEMSEEKLREVLGDLQHKLSQKETLIIKLESDKSLQNDKLQYALFERDSYLKQLEASKSKQQAHDLYLPQIKELEYTIAQQQNEIRGLKDKLSSHDAAAKRAVGTLQNELKVRVDQVTKKYDDCRKEKDSMVIKYAQAENKNIELQKATEKAEGTLRDILREREIFLMKAKQLKADYHRTSAELETKSAELLNVTKELDKHKELITSSEVRIKWAQNKMKAELEAHKETKKELEKSNGKIKEAKEETEQIRRDCQAIIKTYQESEEMKSSTLDQRLRKKETELLLEKREKTDQSEVYQSVRKELDSLKVQYKDNLEELNTYRDKVRAQESERLTNEETMTKYKDIIQTQKKENRELQAKIDKLFHVQSDFDRAQGMIKSLDADIRDLKLGSKELQTEIECCRKRESDLLHLTRTLTEKNAQLQSENTTLSGQVMNINSDNQKKDMDIQEFETKLKDVSDQLEEERKSRKSDVERLTETLASKTRKCEELSRTVEELKDEIKTLKRKHANNIKDLTRQLQQARRKLENADAKGDNKESVSMGSRTSSNGSLNTASGDMNGGHPAAVPKVTVSESPPKEYPVIVEQVEIDKEVLVNRIVRLQKAHARKNEKIEFMEDHINQLVNEVKKKKKIIQYYVMREEAGILSTENMDINKAELSKRGGIMASVYSSHASDSHMSLELSLEINKKLQSVLEDTLLKNITLKENLDTLGEEIARLSQENRRLQLTLQGL